MFLNYTMERRLLLSLCAMLVCIAFVSSELAITEPADIYNLGDKLFVTATGLKGYDQGNLNID